MAFSPRHAPESPLQRSPPRMHAGASSMDLGSGLLASPAVHYGSLTPPRAEGAGVHAFFGSSPSGVGMSPPRGRGRGARLVIAAPTKCEGGRTRDVVAAMELAWRECLSRAPSHPLLSPPLPFFQRPGHGRREPPPAARVPQPSRPPLLRLPPTLPASSRPQRCVAPCRLLPPASGAAGRARGLARHRLLAERLWEHVLSGCERATAPHLQQPRAPSVRGRRGRGAGLRRAPARLLLPRPAGAGGRGREGGPPALGRAFS